jgi:hypothetical protein
MLPQVRKEILIEFLEDVKTVMSKVEVNSATARDYQRLQEFFELANVDQSVVDNMVKLGNFDGWVSFYNERQKPSQDQNVICVRATLGQIKGIGRAVIERLTHEIASLPD